MKTYAGRTSKGSALWLAAPSGRSVWMLQADCRRGAGPRKCALRLLESANGGRSWARSPGQPPGSVPGSGGRVSQEATAAQTWLVRTGRSSGYVLGEPAVNA